MRDVYATTMRLVDIGGNDAFQVACDRALRWAWRVDAPRPDLLRTPIGRVPEAPAHDETSVEWWSVPEGTARALELKLGHPDDRDDTLQWLATVTITSLDGATRATVRVERGARIHVLKPSRIDFRPPRLVTELMRPPLRAYAGDLELSPGLRTRRAEDMADLVDDILKAEGRALPVLVVSESVSPRMVDHLTKALAGLAQVIRPADRAAERELNAILDATDVTVPPGGLRLYWPEFGSARTIRHPSWTGADVAAGRRDGPSVIKQLVDRLAPISPGRVPADPALSEARRLWLRSRIEQREARWQAQKERARRERQRIADELERARASTSASRDQVARMRSMLDSLARERDESLRQVQEASAREEELLGEYYKLDEEARQLRQRLALLEAENENLYENNRALSEALRSNRSPDETATAVPEDLDSWDAIRDHLPTLVGPGFVLTDHALECTSRPRYPHPSKMWRALRALERVGQRYNELGGALGDRFEDFACEVGGIEVALHDSTYEDACFFVFEGRTHRRLPHVKVDDAKSPNEVGRIYFALDREQKRIIVDWFGTKPDRPMTRRPVLVPGAC